MHRICFTSLVVLLSLVGNQSVAQSTGCMQLGEVAAIPDDPLQSASPHLVWTGSEYGVVWRDAYSGDTDIYFTRLDASGNPIGDATRVTNDPNESRRTSLVWTGSEYGIAWYDDRDGNREIYFTRLDASGNEIGDDVRVTSDEDTSVGPALVWTGNEYGVAWQDGRDGDHEIYFTRLDAAGNKIGDDIRVTEASGSSRTVSLAWTGSEFGVAWGDYRDGRLQIYFTRLDSSGNEIGDDVRVTNSPGNSRVPSLVWTGREFGVAWYSDRDGNYEIYFVRLDASGNKIGDDLKVRDDLYSASLPSLTWTGREYGVAWVDRTPDGIIGIGMTRLDAEGKKNSEMMRLAIGPDSSTEPSLVWSDTGYGLTWYDNHDWVDYQGFFARVGCGCTEFKDHSAYGRLLFESLCTQDANNLVEDTYDARTVGINNGPNDAFYLSSNGMSFAPLVVDDVVDCDGQDSGLGPYAPQPNVPPFVLDVPIEINLAPLPAHEITSLIPPGTSQLPFELLDVEGSIYGHTAVYLVRDCGIHVGKESDATLHWLSHDVEVLGFQSNLDVVSGVITQLHADRDFSRACFLGSFSDTTQVVDTRPVFFNGGYYYLVSGTCASAIGYGNSSTGPRGDLGTAPECP